MTDISFRESNGRASTIQLPPELTSGGGFKVGLVDGMPEGDKLIGKTGYQLKRVSTSFNRPADTMAYAIGDAATNSTSAPVVFQLDLGAAGAVAGQGIEVQKLRITSSVKGAVLPLFNAFLSSVTFTTSNDNAALDVADNIMTAGSWFACDVQNYTAGNASATCLIPQPLVLDAADTKLYGTLQLANAYTPASGETFTITAWVALL